MIHFTDVCIWIQAESTQCDDIIIKDGQSLSKNNEEYQTIANITVGIQSTYIEIGKEGNIKIYKIPQVGFLLMSNLQETDKVNRKRAFSAIIKRDSIDECWRILNQKLNQHNFHCVETDYTTIMNLFKEYNEKKNIRTLLKLGISVLVILGILFCILKIK